MDEKLLRFFKLVGYNDVIAFENAHLKDMVINKRENTWTLRINAKSIINLTSILNLKKLCRLEEHIQYYILNFHNFHISFRHLIKQFQKLVHQHH